MRKRKEIQPKKLKDMVRSILPSKNREAARKAKAMNTRQTRRGVRADLHAEDPETTDVDFLRDANQSYNVRWRRDGDKLNHFMRWCNAITKGMTKEDALAFVRSILPKDLIGDHAYGHWEVECMRRGKRQIPYREVRRRREQSEYDRLRHALRVALETAPELLGELNADIKSRKPFDETRRLLRGIHDVDDFVRDVLTKYWVFCDELHAVKRAVASATARPTIHRDETCRPRSLPAARRGLRFLPA